MMSILDKLDEAEQKASGPWKVVLDHFDDASGICELEDSWTFIVRPFAEYEDSGTTEAEFIVLMRNNIRALIDVARAADELLEKKCIQRYREILEEKLTRLEMKQ